MTEESQEFLEALTDRLAAFKPTHVLLEYNPESEEVMNERYSQYLSGEYELGANEIYQLGFRIARKAGLDGVQSFDHRELHWAYQPMAKYAEEHDSPEFAEYQRLIEELVAEMNKARAELSFPELLAQSNDQQMDNRNMGSYLDTNSIGANDGWSGADATATWWQRNFRMYARAQKVAQPGTRVIAIAGSGHTAILKFLLSIDSQREAVDASPFITGE